MKRLAVVLAIALGAWAGDASAQSSAPPASDATAPSHAEPTATEPIAPTEIAPITITQSAGDPTSPSTVMPLEPRLSSTIRVEVLSPRVVQRVEFDPPAWRRMQGTRTVQCTTPCALDLQPGDYRVFTQIEGRSTGSSHVEVRDGADRVILREPRSRIPAALVTGTGALAFLTGTILLSTTLATQCSTCPPIDTQPAVVGSLSLLVVGAAVLGVGIWSVIRARSVIDHVESRAEPLPREAEPARVPAPSAAPAATPAAPREREQRMGTH